MYLFRGSLDSPVKIAIECFGVVSETYHDERANEMRAFWADMRDHGWTFLEFSSSDLQGGKKTFICEFLETLRQRGVKYRRLSEQEIWERIRPRAVYRFTKAMESFIGHCRRNNLSPKELYSRIEEHVPCSEHEDRSLNVGASIYEHYLEHLALEGTEDFSGLVWRAVEKVREGETTFIRDREREQGDLSGLSFVMIDEFQDFSAMFFALVDAIRSVNHIARFFCVGDDWQAINAFAGSDLRYFKGFDDYFDEVISCEIPSNYRSAHSIVTVGNALMHEEGIKAKPVRIDKGIVWLGALNELQPSDKEYREPLNKYMAYL